jgi:WS/DGAT/MGAT family acyltransferase
MERLSGTDAAMLYLETPTLHMHTIKVAVLEPNADADYSVAGVKREIGRRLTLLPPFRRRLVEVPLGLHHPVWVECDPDLDHHVGAMRVRPPGGPRELDAVVAEIAGIPLDHRRPLWELTIVRGLAGGRVAIVGKIHHALADGVAVANLLAAAMEPGVAAARATADPLPSGGRLLRDALRDRTRQLVHLPALLRRTATNVVAVARYRREATSAPPLPIRDVPWTPLTGALGAGRAFATTSLPLEAIRSVRSEFGVTVNDVLLALVAGALRAYLSARGGLPRRALVAEVPVSTDAAGAGVRTVGNRLSNLFTSLCSDVADPAERLRAIHAVTREAKTLHDLLGPDMYGEWTAYAPPWAFAWLVRQYSRWRLADRHRPPVNLIVSCVPGPREALRWSGGRLESIFSVGPIIEGAGLNVTAWSYVDRLNVGVLSCPRRVPDPHAIADRLADELDLLHAAGTSQTSMSPATRRSAGSSSTRTWPTAHE